MLQCNFLQSPPVGPQSLHLLGLFSFSPQTPHCFRFMKQCFRNCGALLVRRRSTSPSIPAFWTFTCTPPTVSQAHQVVFSCFSSSGMWSTILLWNSWAFLHPSQVFSIHCGSSLLHTTQLTNSVELLNTLRGTWRRTHSRSREVFSWYLHRHTFLGVSEQRQTWGGRSSANLDLPITTLGLSSLKQRYASIRDMDMCRFWTLCLTPPSLMVTASFIPGACLDMSSLE